MSYQTSFEMEPYGEAPSPYVPRACDNRSLPVIGTVAAVTPNRVTCAKQPAVFGVNNPGPVVTSAVARAVEMVDNTIRELVNARQHVCAGEPPAWPLLGDITADWLKNRLGICIDDIHTWTAGTFVNRSVAEVIRRLVRVRNLIASNAIRYICSDAGCSPGDWAFVFIDPTCKDTPPTVIRLCRAFWVKRADVTANDQAEFQAQTILHEASHLFHCTQDKRGASIGVAECLAQFVAATNGSPIDPHFAARCTHAQRCAGPPPAAGLGFAAPTTSSLIRLTTKFEPQKAIRLKGRPAVRHRR
jgi:Lysine-specific metallo-endopeptidase